MGDYRRVAVEEAAITCGSPGCRNAITDEVRSMKIMTGHGEVMDFCNRTCLKTFLQVRVT